MLVKISKGKRCHSPHEILRKMSTKTKLKAVFTLLKAPSPPTTQLLKKLPSLLSFLLPSLLIEIIGQKM